MLAGRRWSWLASFLVVPLVLGASAGPAWAGGWTSRNLSVLTGAPPSAGGLFGYTTALSNQGLVARVVYATDTHQIEELSYGAAHRWHATNLSAVSGAPPLDEESTDPIGFTTDLANQGLTARVLYSTSTGRVEELSTDAAHGWHKADLTATTGAVNAALSPSTSTTDFPGQGPVTRVAYVNFTRPVTGLVPGPIEALSIGSAHVWRRTDLTAVTGAPPGLVPMGYTTNLPGQGQVARIVYVSADHHIHEVSMNRSLVWHHVDLTAVTGAPGAEFAAAGYTTNFPGQGPVARVVYVTTAGQVVELSLGASRRWRHTDLTAVTHAPAGFLGAAGYVTNLRGQGPVARIVYRTPGGHIMELSAGPAPAWRVADLTVAGHARPIDSYLPQGYTSNLPGQGPVARLPFVDDNGQIEELSAS